MDQPLPQLFPPGQGSTVTAQSVASSLASTVNELQRWFSRTTPMIVDDVFHPKTVRQTVLAGFTIEPDCYNIELTCAGDVTSDAANAVADGRDHGQIILIENISAFNITILNAATTMLNGAVDFIMHPSSTLTLKWDGTNWVEVARSQNS